MFGALKPGFRSLATLKLTCSECFQRTLNRKELLWHHAVSLTARLSYIVEVAKNFELQNFVTAFVV